ncbi:hypothetical protein HBI46_233450 [Parastagonospora nodorum]|nr:hypothetical protein HBI46_233450 [Parastagonospora nodorum]
MCIIRLRRLKMLNHVVHQIEVLRARSIMGTGVSQQDCSQNIYPSNILSRFIYCLRVNDI